MRREEWEEGSICAECGAEIDPSRDPEYLFGDDWSLCGECAARRGGVYDTAMDRWAVLPDVTGLVTHRPQL
jgi:hypothetical protein